MSSCARVCDVSVRHARYTAYGERWLSSEHQDVFRLE